MPAPYLANLTIRLAAAIGELPEEYRNRQADFLRRAQQPDGGFAGREGGSDLYYTSFTVRGLAILGQLDESVGQRVAAFLQSRLAGDTPMVDFFSLIFAAALLESATAIDVFAQQDRAWPDRVAAALEDLRRDDGGYAKGREGRASSTYHSFLVVLCHELIDRPLPQPDRLAQFLLDQRRDDGGFVEIRAARRSGTNPTSAAIAVLRILEEALAATYLTEKVCEAAIDFLAESQTDEGGIRANTRIPIADLLSTFTGLLTLTDLGAIDQIDRAAAAAFVDSLSQPQGGFHGAAWDVAADVEYTFYGLGAAALLQQPHS